MRKIAIVLIVIGLVAGLAAAYVIAPYVTMKQISRAIAARDAAKLEALVDWPRVRDGLKTDLRIAFFTIDPKLGLAMDNRFLDAFIDKAASPTGLFGSLDAPAFKSVTWKAPVRSGLVSPTEFIIVFDTPGQMPATFTMKFNGITWKVVRAQAPGLLASALASAKP